jgi:hypothetical protein
VAKNVLALLLGTYPAFRHELGRLQAGSLLEVRHTIGPRPGFVCTST